MDLHQAFSAYGLLSDSLVMDGSLHRCGTVRKPRDKNGWYIIFDGGAAAVFGNWENGDGHEYWKGQNVEFDYERVRRAMDAVRAERESKHNEVAKDALAYFESCSRDGYSDYLKKKRCYPHGARFDGNVLVLPVQDSSGKIWSTQKIYGDGFKCFAQGGRVQGCYYPIFGRNVSKDELVVVCEGFATGASIHQETGLPVVVAFNAGNLKAVCDSLPFRNLIIAADNDESGVGEKKAKESGYKYVMPKIVGWDYSDVFLNGKEFKSDFITPVEVVNDFEVHGLVGKIADWITETAIHPQPKLSLAAALGFVAMIRGHKICGGTDLRTNLLIMSMSPTGGGKDHPQKCIVKLANACGLGRNMLGEPVSGGGFLTGLLEANRVGLLVIDEVGRFLGNISNKNSGGYQKEIVDYIIKTFSCANSTLYGRQHVDTKKNPRVDIQQPHFCCVGSSVKEKIKASCSSTDVLDGFLNRWLVFDADVYVDRKKEPKKATPPQELVDLIVSSMGTINYNAYGEPEPTEVSFTPEAWDIFVIFRNKIDVLVRTSGHPVNALYNRTCEHVEKVALTLCDGEDILCSDVRLAIQIVEESNKSILQFVGLISDNVFEEDFIRVREKIKDVGEIAKGALTYKCQFVTGGVKRINEIVNILLDGNHIVERVVGKKTLYKWIG
jgi:putative DNA primase/helicase